MTTIETDLYARIWGEGHPERIRSLVAIEPPAFGLALDDPVVAADVARAASCRFCGS